MKVAWLELRRRPGRFGVTIGVLTLLSVLLLFLGGLLDGLYLNSTGAIRAQKADYIVYSRTARDSFLRSRIEPSVRDRVARAVPGARIGGLGVALLDAVVPGKTKLADVAVIGYEQPPSGVPAPPADGQAYADEYLKGFGVKAGQTLLVGPARAPLTVVGFVSDTNYLLQGGLWTTAATWRSIQNANRPDENVAPGVFQVLTVSGGSASAAAIDGATNNLTKTLTRSAAALALPGVKEQRSTFNQIIYTTVAVAVLVVALFFSLLTLERTGLYGVFKAVGASSRQLFAGVALQAVVVTLVSFALGGLLALGVSLAIPPGTIPLELVPARYVTTLVSLVVAAAIGSIFSLRRVLRIDPASAIGSAQ
jgi:putative ABC transport system permease protein